MESEEQIEQIPDVLWCEIWFVFVENTRLYTQRERERKREGYITTQYTPRPRPIRHSMLIIMINIVPQLVLTLPPKKTTTQNKPTTTKQPDTIV